MKFEFTPEEAQPIALTVAKEFRRQRLKVNFELRAWDDVPYRTSVLAEDGDKKILIEAQLKFEFHDQLRALATWLMVRRHYAEMYIATAPGASMEAGISDELREMCVGLILVSEGESRTIQAARNPALLVNP